MLKVVELLKSVCVELTKLAKENKFQEMGELERATKSLFMLALEKKLINYETAMHYGRNFYNVSISEIDHAFLTTNS